MALICAYKTEFLSCFSRLKSVKLILIIASRLWIYEYINIISLRGTVDIDSFTCYLLRRLCVRCSIIEYLEEIVIYLTLGFLLKNQLGTLNFLPTHISESCTLYIGTSLFMLLLDERILYSNMQKFLSVTTRNTMF